jgi:hypothetical protein
VPLTNLLRANGLLLDRKSFVGYRKSDMTPHLYLKGQDKANLRPLIFKFHKYRCAICRAKIHPDEWPMFNKGIWHHPNKCDCIGCSEIRCDTITGRFCHAHGQPGFQRVAERKEQARKEFDVLYPESE